MQLISPEISGFLEDTALASRRQLLLVKGEEGLCVCVHACVGRGLQWSDWNGESEEGTKKEKKNSKAMVSKNRRSLQWLLSKQGS